MLLFMTFIITCASKIEHPDKYFRIQTENDISMFTYNIKFYIFCYFFSFDIYVLYINSFTI
jgi:hypothetical protein